MKINAYIRPMKILILLVLCLALTSPVMATSVVDVDLGGGIGGFRIEGSSEVWADLSNTYMMTFEEQAKWAGDHGFDWVSLTEVEALFNQLLADGQYTVTENTIIKGYVTDSTDYFGWGRSGDVLPTDPTRHIMPYIWNNNGVVKLKTDAAHPDTAAYGSLGAWLTKEVTLPAPVPEPATYVLMIAGLLGLAGLRKKFTP